LKPRLLDDGPWKGRLDWSDTFGYGGTWCVIALGLLFGLYLIHRIRNGPFRDSEVESRGSSAILGMELRQFFAWGMRPIWNSLIRLDMPPDAITTLSVLLGLASGVAVAAGNFALGGWLYLGAGVCDFLDGRLARITGRATVAGAALDSILDRYVESAVLVGAAWFYRDSWVLFAVLLALVGSLLVPYVRARGEGLGIDVKVGLMQRPERLVFLGFALALSRLVDETILSVTTAPKYGLTVFAIVVLAFTAHLTALWRLRHVLDALTPSGAKPIRRTRTLLKTIVSSMVATGGDFVLVLFLVEQLAVPPALAAMLGCVLGGCINFLINRDYVFQNRGQLHVQASRYFFVSGTSALLNGGGVAVLMMLPGVDYRLAWLIARGAVFLTWNFPLQRDFVFAAAVPEPEPLDAANSTESELDEAEPSTI
jgi:phosphatidylglycerophosphate synthase/putative flippase GtrA